MATAERVLTEARARIGDSGWESWNHFGRGAEAWCADFASMCLDLAGVDFEPSASAAGLCTQFERIEDADARAGDLVFFGWDGIRDVYFRASSHVAIVEEWTHDSDYFTVIEGNSGNVGCTETTVCRTTYDNEGNFFTAFFRPPYDGAESGGGGGSTDTRQLFYEVETTGGWCDTMSELVDTGGSGDDFAGVLGESIITVSMDATYRVLTAAGWSDWVTGRTCGGGGAGDGTPIMAVDVADTDIAVECHWMEWQGMPQLDGIRAWLV